MFTTLYKPKTIKDFVGNKDTIDLFKKWLSEWKTTNIYKCLLLSGICGIGKSLLVELILNEYKYNIINIGPETDNNKETMERHIQPLLKVTNTFCMAKNILVVSDIESTHDQGFITNLVNCIKITKIPIIIICDNKYNQPIKPIIEYCYSINMTKPTYNEVLQFIKKIMCVEHIHLTDSSVRELYEQSNGDIRFILNQLQFGLVTTNKNIQNLNIFDTTSKLLSVDETIDQKYDIYSLDNELHLLMLQENYINNIFNINDPVKKIEYISNSSNYLSDADIFKTSLAYDTEQYVTYSAISSTLKCNKKTLLKFPQILGKLSIIHKNKKEKMNNLYKITNISKHKSNTKKSSNSKKSSNIKK